MYFIVINPNAERGQFILRLPMLKALFDAAGLEYEVHITTKAMDGYEKTLRFCKRNSECKGIIGVGGDGIIQEIVAGMVDAFPESHEGQKIPTPLAILPSSTGNDFVSTLEGNITKAHAKYRKAPEIVVKDFFDTLMKGQRHTIDVITAGGMAFLNVGHVGLDSRIAQNAATLKQKYDEYAYWVAGFKSIISHENIFLKADISGTKYEGQYVLAAVCNGQYYGGGMCIAPEAKIDDGKIAVCLISGMNRLKTMFCFPTLLVGKHERLKNVAFIECNELKLTLPPTILCLDGNFYQSEGDVEFKILPSVLEVFV